MIKKLLILLVFTGLIAVSGLIAQSEDQLVQLNVPGVVSLSVSDVLDFGDVMPGTPKSVNSTITLNPENTENIKMNVYLQNGSDTFLTKIAFNSTDAVITGGPANLGIGSANSLEILITDDDADEVATSQPNTIVATLDLPFGTKSTQKSGTIIYEFVAQSP